MDYTKLYTEIDRIGKGNYGAAYLVRNNEDKCLYIAKKISLESLDAKEFDSAFGEATLLKNLKSPHIVSYKNSYCSKTMLIIVMEYCESNLFVIVEGDIETLIKKEKAAHKYFTEEQIMQWFVQICLGLSVIHSKRILHRDLKASNIFMTSTNCIKIGDFGISKILKGTLEAALTVVGTPYYMSPELCRNEPYTLKSDIWSLGCLLYELASLKVFFL